MPALDPNLLALMDNLVRPILQKEGEELNHKVRHSLELSGQAGILWSPLAGSRVVVVNFEHYKDLAQSIWATMLRVLEATEVTNQSALAAEIKGKFDSYLKTTADRIRSSVSERSAGRATATFDGICEEVRQKYHPEIDLFCATGSAQRKTEQRSQSSEPKPMPTEHIASRILQALKDEWEREPELLNATPFEVIATGLMNECGFTQRDIDRGLRFLIERDCIRAINEPKRVLPSVAGLDFLKSRQQIRKVDYRIHVDQIDSFERVRTVTAADVADLLANGYLNSSEDSIQTAIEEILGVPNHKKDWGGEQNDLYTANLVLCGHRVPTAFLLKGNGLKKNTMEISDCGKNGDQLLRLVRSPAQLFIVQFVGNFSESVISDLEGKVEALQNALYCIIDGQDTARLLRAYGKA